MLRLISVLVLSIMLSLTGCNEVADKSATQPVTPESEEHSQQTSSLPLSSDESEYQTTLAPGYRIAFYTNYRGQDNSSLDLMDTGNKGIITLTDNFIIDEPYVWSPDGQRIAFVSTEISGQDIFVVNADGSGLKRLTGPENPSSYGGTLNGWPSWSPDGKRIVFQSRRGDVWGTTNIFIIDVDGTNEIQLTGGLQDEEGILGSDSFPAWSPDGTRIAFISKRENNSDIYIINVDGTGITKLTNNEADNTDPFGFTDPNPIWFPPAWSPDGTCLLFTRKLPDTNEEIYVINADSGEENRLTSNTYQDGNPTWSPDGQYIAFDSNRDGKSNWQIYVMNKDGTNQTRLTYNPDYSYTDPSWSPDGRYIACERFPDIYVINSSGTGQINITENDISSVSSHSSSWDPG